MNFGITAFELAIAFSVLLVVLIFRNIILKIIFKFLKLLAKKTVTTLDDELLETLENPVKNAILVIGIYLSLYAGGLHNEFIYLVLKTAVIVIIFWMFYNAIGVFKGHILKTVQRSSFELATEISDLLIRVIRFFIVAAGIVAVLEQWDINISTFVASLGIGGLAFALAAKDTVANFFGGVMIFADRSFKTGDWVKGAGVEGIIEGINIRSTKIRTFEKSLITVPNANLANSPIENFSRRGIRRINMRIGLTYATSVETMEAIVADIRSMLKTRKDIDQETILIYFDQFADSSLSIFCYYFTHTAVWQDYLSIREKVNLEIIKIVQNRGAEFAFPSQSIYFENELPVKQLPNDSNQAL
jgi:MscS family membrane protein